MRPRIPIAHIALSTCATLFVLFCLIVIQDSGRGSLNPLTGRFLGVLSGTTTDPRAVWNGYDQSLSMEKRVFRMRAASPEKSRTYAIPRVYLGLVNRSDRDGRLLSVNISVAADNFDPWKLRRSRQMSDAGEISIVLDARLAEDVADRDRLINEMIDRRANAMQGCTKEPGPVPHSELYRIKPEQRSGLFTCLSSTQAKPAFGILVSDDQGVPAKFVACSEAGGRCYAGGFDGIMFFRFKLRRDKIEAFEAEIERVRGLIRGFQVTEADIAPERGLWGWF